jgi:hypothetical protein
MVGTVMKVKNGEFEIVHSGTYLVTVENNNLEFEDIFTLGMSFIAGVKKNDDGEVKTWVETSINNGFRLKLYNFFEHDAASSKGFSQFFRRTNKVTKEIENYYLAFSTQSLSPTSISTSINIAKQVEMIQDCVAE